MFSISQNGHYVGVSEIHMTSSVEEYRLKRIFPVSFSGIELQHTFDKRHIIANRGIVNHGALQIDIVAIKHSTDDIWHILPGVADACDIDFLVRQIE